jgi:hypothetical protein
MRVKRNAVLRGLRRFSRIKKKLLNRRGAQRTLPLKASLHRNPFKSARRDKISLPPTEFISVEAVTLHYGRHGAMSMPPTEPGTDR